MAGLRVPGSTTAGRNRPWYLPGTVTLGFIVLGAAAIVVDRTLLSEGGISFAFDGGPRAASQILSTIAGSIITVAGLAFSLTIVTIQLVSGQFSPRTVGTFLNDRFNQVCVGCFSGVFAYCIVVLRSIRTDTETGGGFVPGLSVNLGILLGLGSVQLLVVFIYRVGRSIDVGDIATRLGQDTQAEVKRQYPDRYGSGAQVGGGELIAAWRTLGAAQVVYARQSGYVERVRVEAVTAALASGPSRASILVCAGDFVTLHTAIAELWTEEPLAPDVLDDIAAGVSVTSQRTLPEDPEFGLRQLTDIGLRAISPGVNDPTTAVMCIGYLRNLLEQRVARADQSDLVEADRVTLVLRRRSFTEDVHASVVELGRYAAGDARVVSSLLECLQGVAAAAVDAGATSRLPVLADAIEAVAGPALADARTDLDRGLIASRLDAARRAVAGDREITSSTAR